MLPDEIMLLLFQRLGPYALGRCACVCRQWRLLTEHPRLWERACRDTFTPAYRCDQPPALRATLNLLS